jgi:hypothetical protein
VTNEPDAQMCAQCFTPLNPFLDSRELVGFHHPDNTDGWDHEPEPVPRDDRVVESCDFCAQPGGSVVFRTAKTVIVRIGPVTNAMGYCWSACERCAGYIRSNSVHLLIDRALSVARHPDHGGSLNRLERRAMREQFKDIHMAFIRAQPTEIRGERQEGKR